MLDNKTLQTANLLLTQNDFNIRFTVACNTTPTNNDEDTASLEGRWKEAFRDSMGEITGAVQFCKVECIVAKNGDITKFHAECYTSKIISNFWPRIYDADGVKFTIKPTVGSTVVHVVVRS